LEDKLYNTTIALAGMMQAVSLVRELAQTGKADDAAFQVSISSIFQMDPQKPIDVYGNTANLRLGLQELIRAFSGKTHPNQSLMQYVLSLIRLQKKITGSTASQNLLKQRLNQAKKQVEYFSLTHPTVISNLADIYLNTISSFKFRIMIWGSSRILSTSEVMDKIRALLLAGIRSAVLWRQMGGSRLQLLFFRTKIKTMAENK
jgi:high frequency lysogenization protein